VKEIIDCSLAKPPVREENEFFKYLGIERLMEKGRAEWSISEIDHKILNESKPNPSIDEKTNPIPTPSASPLPLFSAEPAKETKTDYKDAFLSFALEKVEDYSGKMESAINKAVDVAQKEIPQVVEEYLPVECL